MNYSDRLKATWLNSELGAITMVADEEYLYVLDFVDHPGSEDEVEDLSKKLKATIIPGRTPIINSIESELMQYFAGKLREFKTPVRLLGTPFQKQVWEALRKIPYGKTRSYLDIARAVHNPTGFRAVAQANGANRLSIIIPCHRVINNNGKLGGYGGGLARKQWLLELEKSGGRNE